MKLRGLKSLPSFSRRNPSHLNRDARRTLGIGKLDYARQLLRGRPFWYATIALWLGTWGLGCRLMQKAADVPVQTIRAFNPGAKGQPPVDLPELQQTLMRFSDDYLTRVCLGIDQLKWGTNTIPPAKILTYKIEFTTEGLAIASGPNSLANLLDMTVFVSLSKDMLQKYLGAKSLRGIRAAVAGGL